MHFHLNLPEMLALAGAGTCQITFAENWFAIQIRKLCLALLPHSIQSRGMGNWSVAISETYPGVMQDEDLASECL